jgi:hypothetical protein
MVRNPTRRLGVVGLGLIALFHSGCIEWTPRPERMQWAGDLAGRERSFPFTVVVAPDPDVTIRDDGPLAATIGTDTFVEAVASSIVSSLLFDEASVDGRGDFRLYVTVFDISFGQWSGAYSCKLSAEWKLVRDDGSAEVVFHEPIESQGRSSYYPNGATIATRTREAAAQNNIAAGLQRLSELDL